jgi:predicted metal-dependent hydrolase
MVNNLAGFFNLFKLDTFTNKLTDHKIGKNKYKVYEEFNNKKDAADILNKVSINLLALIKYMDIKYNDNTINNYYKMRTKDKLYILDALVRTKRNYRPNNVQENLPTIFDKDTSYTINKGEVFALCLRFVHNKDNFHDFNTIMFVALHELAHLFSKTYGHNTEFWTNFRFILKEAVEAGFYTPVDYKRYKKPYCSIVINYNPLFDNNLRDY